MSDVEAILEKPRKRWWINARTSEGNTMLHQSAYYGVNHVVRILLTAGASVNARDNDGRRPLHDASTLKGIEDLEITKPDSSCELDALLEYGADIDACDNRGRTALHEAFSSGYWDGIYSLVEAGASITIRDKQGMTAIDSAVPLLEFEPAAVLHLLLKSPQVKQLGFSKKMSLIDKLQVIATNEEAIKILQEAKIDFQKELEKTRAVLSGLHVRVGRLSIFSKLQATSIGKLFDPHVLRLPLQMAGEKWVDRIDRRLR